MRRRASHPLTILVLLAALAVLAAPSAPPSAAQAPGEAYRRVATWQSSATPRVSGLFKAPWGAAVGPDGRIYVADAGLGAVHVLAADGSALALWDAGGAGLGAVRDLAWGDGRLFVSDPDGDRIHVLGPDGRVQDTWSLSGGPGGLAYDGAAGRLYVTTLRGHGVRVLDASGELRGGWDAADSQMEEPWGIAVGPDGRVYVGDVAPAVKIVWIFDAQGVLSGGLQVSLDNVAQAPIDVAVDEDGDIFVATELSLARYHEGQLVGRPVAAPGGRGLAIGPGSGLVATAQDFRLGFTGLRHYRDRRALNAVVDAWGGPFAPLGALEGPRRVSANADDRVFVLDTWPRVQSWRGDGTPRAQLGAGGLHDIAAGPRGSVFAIEGRALGFWPEDGIGGALWRWLPPDSTPASGPPTSWLMAADGFARAEGHAAALLDLGDQRLFVLDTSGNPLAEWPLAPPEGFESVADLALGQDRVYWIHRGRAQVEARRLTDGALLEAWTVPGSPIRLDLGADGSLYVLVREGWVWKYATGAGAPREPRAFWPVLAAGEPLPPIGGAGATDLAAGEAGRVYVSLGEAGEIRVFEPDPAGQPGPPPVLADRCTLARDKVAAPARVAVGEPVEIRLSVEGECPLADARSDILLLVDTSGSMSGSKMGAARSAALEFVGQLDYSLNQVGLISFSTDVALVQPLTQNPRALIRAIPGLGDDSGTNMLGAIQMAEQELAGPRARPAARKVIVLLTDGRPNTGEDVIQALAASFRRRGIEVYAIGLGLDVDRSFLSGIATHPGYYFEAPTEYELSRVYETIGRRVAASALLGRARVTDVLPPDMRFVPGSAAPPADYDAASRSLSWDLRQVGTGGLLLRYRVVPQQPGLRPTNAHAEIDYEDGLGKAGRLVFPVPEVEVVAPERWLAHLPILYRQQCPELRTDVVLALDTSASMREAARPGAPTKLDAAVQAARVFLGQLALPRDRVAIVAFSGTAETVQPLSGDVLALLGALERLPAGNGTRIDLGLAKALDALGPTPPGRLPALVLLTDGNQSGAPESEVDAAAARAAAAGLRVYTIGLGGDANLPLLARVAGDSRRAYFAPSEADLAAIYRSIAGAIPCE